MLLLSSIVFPADFKKKKKIRLQNEAKNTTIHMEMSFICIRIKQSFSYQWLIVHLASSWNWKDFLELASGLLNVGFLLSPYFYWFYTPATLLWKLLPFLGGLWQSRHLQEFPILPVGSIGGVWRFSESDIYVIIRYFRSTYWIGSWILVLGSGKLKKYIWML